MIKVHPSYRVGVTVTTAAPTNSNGKRLIVKFENGELKLNHRHGWDYSKDSSENVIAAFNEAIAAWEQKHGFTFFKEHDYILTEVKDYYILCPLPNNLNIS